MSSRQLAVLEGLVDFGAEDGPKRLGTIYEGVLVRLVDTAAPDSAAQAAHGARELMEKLGWRINEDTPEERGSLGDRAEEIESAYEKAVAAMPPERALWEDTRMTPEVLTLVDAVGHMSEWRRIKTVSRSRHASLMVDFSMGRMPEHVRTAKRKEWIDLREFFTDVAHHREVDDRQQTLADVAFRFRQLEEFLYARWAPQTVRDFAEIDALLASEED